LSPPSGNLAIVDGVDGAIMIAGKTTGTPSIVNPYGGCTFEIIHRTDLGAFATTDTYVLIHHELVICNHVFVEVAANDIGIESWCGTLLQFFDSPFPVSDDGGDMAQLVPGVFNLPEFLVLRIGMHEGQTDIRLRHDDSEDRLSLKSYGTEFLVEYRHALAHVVATSGEGPTEGIATNHLQSSDEVADNPWGLPTMRGETESNALSFSERERIATFPDEVRDIKKFLTDGLCYLLCHPSGIACA
jgi:hypothetical protein